MLEASDNKSRSAALPKMAPELSTQEQHKDQQDPSEREDREDSVPGTPPRSPSRNEHYRKPSTGKEEDAAMSLMRLATPVKSPGPRGGFGASIGETTPGVLQASADGAEMTPVSLFRKSRQPGELGGQLQSPFQSPLKNFHFSPSCLFSPPGAGTLDFPLADTNTPAGQAANRDPWQQTTPDRRGSEHAGGPEAANGGEKSHHDESDRADGACATRGGGGGGGSSGDGGGESGGTDRGVGSGTPGTCGKRKGKALFTDKRGPQDHSRGLGQGAWCLGTPGRSTRENGVSHLGSADIPATPDRTVGSVGAEILPPTPQLLPPTPPPRSSRGDADAASGGDDAAGILMGLRSPESLSTFSSGGNIAQALFSGLEDDDSHRGIVERSWSEDWENRGVLGRSGRDGREDLSMSVKKEITSARRTGDAPHTAPMKRHRRHANAAVSLRDAHCKGSFTIDRGTLIRSSSISSALGGAASSGGGGGGGGASSARKRTPASRSSSKQGRRLEGAHATPDAASRAKNSGESIVAEPLSPPLKSAPSPESASLSLSRRSEAMTPTRTAAANRKSSSGGGGGGGGGAGGSDEPTSVPRPSARGARAERARKGAAVNSNVTASAAGSVATVTPSPVAASGSSSKPGRSTPKPPPLAGGGGTPARARASLEASSFNSPEPTTSSRRGRASAPKQQVPSKEKKGDGGAREEEMQTTPVPAATGGPGGGEPGGITCNCKKSKCLKLYCECFQRRLYCSDCNCQECLNTERTKDLRQAAIQSTIERNPQAFESKFEKRAGKRSHNAGCNCKKSACLKKYCECFQAGVACGTNCKCSNCKNYEGATGGRKRRAAEPLPPRTPPRMSARVGSAPAATMAAAVASEAAATTLTMPVAHGHVNASSASHVQGTIVPQPSPDHHVQVGDEDDQEAVPPSPLLDALRARSGPSATSMSSLTGDTGEDSGNCSAGSGGGDPSEIPAATAAIEAVRNRTDSGRSTSSSPAASAVADCAVAKSLLDMGSTPLLVQEEEESGTDTKFELSVAAGSPGGVHPLSARLLQQQRGVPRRAELGSGLGGSGGAGGGGRKASDDENALGMGALLRRAQREAEAENRRKKSATADVNTTAGRESFGDGNGGLVASSLGKAGGQACLTPPTPTTWKGIMPGLVKGTEPVGTKADSSVSGAVHRGNDEGVATPEVTTTSAPVAV